jgi:triacylglycerol esterase/lipase EstA (alpha/beta hydrolase family)
MPRPPSLYFIKIWLVQGVGNVADWGRIPDHLRDRGTTVLEAKVSGTGHMTVRAAQLRSQVDAFLAAHPYAAQSIHTLPAITDTCAET